MSGLLGGLIGIGGGAIVVPALTLIFHKHIQIAFAASLVQMVFMSAASAYGHYRNRYLLKGLLKGMVPCAVVSSIGGVILAKYVSGHVLYGLFAIFLVYVSGNTGYRLLAKLLKGHPDRPPVSEYTPPNTWAVPAVAVPMGFSSGLLGIGGGALAVPALNVFLKLPLKNAIANSSAAIFFSSILASILKLQTINGMVVPAADGTAITLSWTGGLVVGLLVAPGAFVGGRIGAHLAKKFPTKVLQAIFIVVMLYSAYGMWQKAQLKPSPQPAAVELQAPSDEDSVLSSPAAAGDSP